MPATVVEESTSKLYDATLERRLERIGESGAHEEWTERYLVCGHLVDPRQAKPRQRFEAVAAFVRDLVAHRWVKTRLARENADPKRVYYLSMEFLLGRTLSNNLINLFAEPMVARALERAGWHLEDLVEEEPDAGLGNGGLGRLAACFIDSLATLQYSGIGYGLRYEYGIFKQTIHDGFQVEQPDNWLRRPDPWEIPRVGKMVKVPLGCGFHMEGGRLRLVPGQPTHLQGVAHDRPVVGYGGKVVN